MIRKLHEAGADVFRLNMSHGTHPELAEKHAIIRQVEADLGSTIGTPGNGGMSIVEISLF